jgi:hypothetical protein
MSPSDKQRPSLNGEKLLARGIAALCFLAVASLAWWELPLSLWHWANAAWWHWPIALCLYFLLLWPPILALHGAGSMVAAAGAGGWTRLRWEAMSYIAAIAVAALILWAFASAPSWWARWHWWLWGAGVVACAAVCAGGRMILTVHEVRAPKAKKTYSAEWAFNHGDANSPPALGVAMSGGGIRSAAFNLGVLQALHERGILRDVDVMSAVSGGSYAMSWYLLQPFYAAQAAEREHRDFRLGDVIDEMFRPDGSFQTYLCEEPRVLDWTDMGLSVIMDMTLGQLLRALNLMSGDVGQYNMGLVRRDYRQGLQRLFQGVPSPGSRYKILNEIDSRVQWELMQDKSDFSSVMPVTYRELAEFAQRNRLPNFIFNAAVLVQRSHRHMLWPTAFELAALHVGSDACGYRSWESLRRWEPSEHFGADMSRWQWAQHVHDDRDLREHRWVLMVNMASAISGAAVGLSYFNPKKQLRQMRLATWTPFFGNLDLGYLLYGALWHQRGDLYVSDGGHSENLGAYALIKRQCRRIIIVDAEHEGAVPYVFASYTKLKEQLAKEMDLALTITDIDAYLASAAGTGEPAAPPAIATGAVKPMTPDANARPISVIYVKLGLDRKRLASYPANVTDYAGQNSVFPQDPTTNQSYTREQFKAYRDLGHHVAQHLDRILPELP